MKAEIVKVRHTQILVMMNPEALLQKIWQENKLAVLARSRAAFEEMTAIQHTASPQAAFQHFARVFRLPVSNWPEAAAQVWQEVRADFPADRNEFETQLAAVVEHPAEAQKREALRLWLWRRVLPSGRQNLMASRFFADPFLFHRILAEDRLILWYGARVAQWPVQLLLALLLGSRESTQRLRLQLYWPMAKLPAGFPATHAENRALRRLWEARILVRFGAWAHLHPAIMLLLPEVSSFASPVFAWREQELWAHMPDGRIWPIAPFNLAALIFDEALALFQRDRGALWRNFTAYAEDYLARPEDVASRLVSQFFAEWGLHAFDEAPPEFLHEFATSVRFLNELRRPS